MKGGRRERREGEEREERVRTGEGSSVVEYGRGHIHIE